MTLNMLLNNNLVFVLLVLAVFAGVDCAGEPQQNELSEYCQLEKFESKCWKNEVVIIEQATYGRHRVGKCLSPSEASFSSDYKFFGCSADVTSLLGARCSSRKQCEVRVPDADLERTRKCLPGLQMFLEVGYRCVEVVEEDRSCSVTLTSSPLHIASSSSRQSNINCGTKTQPWLLEAPAGQRINISLLDFTDSQHHTRSSSSSSSGSCVHQYGYIIDKSNNVSICAGPSNKPTHLHLSAGHQLQLVLTTVTRGDAAANFLMRIEAVGCTDLIPPEDSWLKRDGDKIIIGCYTSRQTWQLRCVDGRWTGVVSNCSSAILPLEGFPTAAAVAKSSLMDEYQLAVIVAIGFAGLAVCLLIIFCGVVCLRRFYLLNGRCCAASSSSLEKNTSIKYNYIQSSDEVNRRSAVNQVRSAPFVNNTQPQYSVYVGNADGGRADVIGDVTIPGAMTTDRQYFVLDQDAVRAQSAAAEF